MSRACRTHVQRCAVALVLGVISTLFMAWALPQSLLRLGWIKPVPRTEDTFWTDGVRGGHYTRQTHALFEWVDFKRIIVVGRGEDRPYYMRNEPPRWAAVVSLDQREGFEQVLTGVFGWPLRAFKVESWQRWNPQPESTPTFTFRDGQLVAEQPATKPMEELRGGYSLYNSATVRVIVPYKALWPGLVGDVAIFGGGWLVLLYAMAIARQRHRVSRGRCVRCGYDRRGLGSLGVCPECGVEPNLTA